MIDLAWDTETALMGPGRQAPPLTCVSFKEQAEVGLLSHEECLPWFEAKLSDPNILHIGHNIAYDMAVIAAEHPSLLPLIFEAYEGNRVTDTMLRQQLLDNAIGKLRGFWQRFQDKDGKSGEKWVSVSYSLDSCYFRVTKKHLEKDEWRLKYGELRGVPIHMWPAGAQKYPIDDAIATHAVKVWQDKLCNQILEHYAEHQGHIETPRPLADQFAQARSAFWIQLMRVWGIRTREARVDILEKQVVSEIGRIQEMLKEVGLVRADGTRNIKAAQARMAWVRGGSENCKKTDKDSIQLNEEACAESGDPILQDYAEIGSLGTVLSKDVKELKKGEVLPIHSNFSVILATGRTSSSGPNIQNIRRLPGIRECFVPRPGKVFLDADYDGLELRTLAQVCMTLFKKSRLGELLNEGKDPHLMFAAQLLGSNYDDVVARKKDYDVKEKRQLAKAANFGYPGGLGAKTFINFAKGYDVVLTEDEAKKLKADWLTTFPEMAEYFAMISSFGKIDQGSDDPDATKLYCVEQLFSKRLRGDCSYTAACNSLFQGLGADATKRAGFLIAQECYIEKKSPLFGCRIVNYIHDQFLVECPEDRCHDAAWRLAKLMEDGAAPYLPDVPAKVSEPMVSRCWSKDVQTVVDENGRLIPWDKEFEVKSRGG